MTPRRILGLTAVLALAGGAGAQRAVRAPAEWWDRAGQQRVGAYWIKTDVERAEARELAEHLNIMFGEFSRRLAGLPARTPTDLNVLVFARQRDYDNVLRRRFGVEAAGTGGMFFLGPRGSALALFTEGLSRRRVEHVIQHEGFHQFAWSRFGNDLPIWVNEGLAEFFGESVVVDGKLILGQTNPRSLAAVRRAIERNVQIPFRRMLGISHEKWGEALRRGDAGLQYRQAWSMVHFLVYGDAGRYTQRFEAYLRYINAGHLSEQAFVRAFETTDIDAFEKRWTAYALDAKPTAFGTAMERIEFLARGAAALSGKGESVTSLDELRQRLVAIDFSSPITTHDVIVTLEATQNELYEIPMDELCQEPPAFEILPPRKRQTTRREREMNNIYPAPPEIQTINLEPRNVKIRWVREETGVFKYELQTVE